MAKPTAAPLPAESVDAERVLAFVNTLSSRPTEAPVERLVSYDALVEWAREQHLVSAAAAERLAIVFPTNSSYFPPGARAQLRSLLGALGQDGTYEIVLQSSISGSEKVVGAESAEEAMRYNKWLAERRLERVREWLDRNAAGRALTFRQDYRAGDESRQVVVEVRPTG